ncbi:MAG TPA: hypothetical protein VFM57_00710 [Thermoleophilaceae bacterium]|nr:hypothetical protein [Thermoleophilaceae bacterium]
MSRGAVAGRIAALTLVIAPATGGLAAAGVISLPDLPTAASDRAEAAHEAIGQGGDPAEERCAFGLGVAAAASDGQGQAPTASEACERAESAGARDARKADRPERGAQRRDQGAVTQNSHSSFGDSVSDRATSGEPKNDGRAFGESVSGEAQEHAPALPPQAQNAPETGEARSGQGQENAQAFSEQGQATGEALSEQGRQTGDTASGGRVP